MTRPAGPVNTHVRVCVDGILAPRANAPQISNYIIVSDEIFTFRTREAQTDALKRFVSFVSSVRLQRGTLGDVQGQSGHMELTKMQREANYRK